MEEEKQQEELTDFEKKQLEQELLMEAGIPEDFAFYSAFIKD